MPPGAKPGYKTLVQCGIVTGARGRICPLWICRLRRWLPELLYRRRAGRAEKTRHSDRTCRLDQFRQQHHARLSAMGRFRGRAAACSHANHASEPHRYIQRDRQLPGPPAVAAAERLVPTDGRQGQLPEFPDPRRSAPPSSARKGVANRPVGHSRDQPDQAQTPLLQRQRNSRRDRRAKPGPVHGCFYCGDHHTSLLQGDNDRRGLLRRGRIPGQHAARKSVSEPGRG